MKKKIVVISLIVALVAVIAGGTAAYFTAEDTATNVVTAGNVGIKLHEQSKADDGTLAPFKDAHGVMPGSAVSKIVTVENTGSGAAWIRVGVDKAIELAAGREGEVDLSLVSMDFNTQSWTEHDGYYYYNKALAAGETTDPLFTAVTFGGSMGNLYQGSVATVSVSAQAVQSVNNGQSAVEAAGWPAVEGGTGA